MKILYVCHRFPYPPKRGGKIRPFNMIRHFAHTHEVTVASLARSDEEVREAAGIAPHCARFEIGRVSDPVQALRMMVRLPTPTPSSMGFFYSARLVTTGTPEAIASRILFCVPRAMFSGATMRAARFR